MLIVFKSLRYAICMKMYFTNQDWWNPRFSISKCTPGQLQYTSAHLARYITPKKFSQVLGLNGRPLQPGRS